MNNSLMEGIGSDSSEESVMGRWKLVKPVILMVLVQITYAWANVLYKLALNDGMKFSIIVSYRYIFATIFTTPLAFMIERNRRRTNMSWTILFQAFLCGLFGGVLHQNLDMEAIALTSVTFTTAISNLIPAITFIISLFFGIIGSMLIICGLYGVLWGKSEEMKRNQSVPSENTHVI